MNAESLAVAYLKSRAATFSGERVGKSGMLTFALAGESQVNGRLLVKRDGSVSVWHIGARQGLNLGSPWTPEEHRQIGARQAASFTITPEALAALPPDPTPLQKLHRSQTRQPLRPIYDQPAFEAAITHALENAGWKYHRERGGLQYWNDGSGSTPAERVKLGEGIATVWSFRHEVSLPTPWQPGRDTRYGNKTLFVTARDLGIAAHGVSSTARPVVRTERPPINPETVALVRASWAANVPAPVHHPQLNKDGAQLNSTLLRAFPDNAATRHKHLAGDLIAPLFRPNGQGGLELTGAQRLMAEAYHGNDKMMLSGTQTAGAFMPIPPFPLMAERPDIHAWLQQLRIASAIHPLVIAEGVATGMAIHQSGVGNVLVAVSSGNLPAVAQWVKDTGLDQHFPAGVVIAADLDTARDADGKLNSSAIPKAMQAAELVGGKVALATAGMPNGTDARDLLGKGGVHAVECYIRDAVPPESIRQRRDVFPESPQLRVEAAPDMER